MKKQLIGIGALIFCIACQQDSKEKAATEAIVEEVEMISEETQTQDEWITLFDGSNMDAWRGYRMTTVPDAWTIEDETLQFTPSDEGGKNLITKETFTDFVLSLEWKISEGGNSGIFWGVYEAPGFREAYETGPEIQVLDNERHPDANVAHGTHKAGSLYDMIKPEDDLIQPAGMWNSVTLTVNHAKNEGKVMLNGKEAYTFPVHGDAWDTMVANSKFADWKGFGKYKEGHIGLQDHGDKVWYRNIKIKRL